MKTTITRKALASMDTKFGRVLKVNRNSAHVVDGHGNRRTVYFHKSPKRHEYFNGYSQIKKLDI